jgi:hypothetical protein
MLYFGMFMFLSSFHFLPFLFGCATFQCLFYPLFLCSPLYVDWEKRERGEEICFSIL